MTTQQKEFTMCKKCHAYRTPEQFTNAKGRTLKTCTHCREYAKKLREKNKCEHDRSKYTCKKCKQLKNVVKVVDEIAINLDNIENEQKPILKNVAKDIDVIIDNLNNIKNEQEPIFKIYDCVDGCPYCTPDYCNISHPGCICNLYEKSIVNQYDKQKKEHKTVKKLFANYIKWINESKYSQLNDKQTNAVKCLRTFWNGNNYNLDEYYDIKKHHTLINGCSGNEDIWMKYISAAMKMRLKLSCDQHN